MEPRRSLFANNGLSPNAAACAETRFFVDRMKALRSCHDHHFLSLGHNKTEFNLLFRPDNDRPTGLKKDEVKLLPIGIWSGAVFVFVLISIVFALRCWQLEHNKLLFLLF